MCPKRAFLSISFLLSTFFLFGQKVNRAIEALTEKKYDKAENLFGDVLRKDSNDVAALIGYALTMNQDASNIAYKNNLETAHRLLIRAEKIYPTYSQSDRNFILTHFKITRLYDIETLHATIIDRAWTFSYASSSSLSEVERFIKELAPYNGNARETYRRKLITLTYDSLMKSPTVEALQQFQKKYPNNEYVGNVNEKIESLRYDEALRAANREIPEKFIQDYPGSKKIKSVYVHLAELRFKSLDKNNSRSAYQGFVDYFQKSPYGNDPSIASKISIIQEKIEELDFQELGDSESLEKLSLFLQNHKDGKHFTEVLNRVATLEYSEILQTESYYKLPDYMEKYPFRLSWSSDTVFRHILNQSKKYTQETLYRSFLEHIQTTEKIPAAGTESFAKVLFKNLPTTFTADSTCVLSVLETKTNLENNNWLYSYLAESCLLEQVPEVSLLHKFESFELDNSQSYFYTGYIELGMNGKTTSFFYTEQNEVAKMSAVNRIGTQAKLFELIKGRYDIRSFSQPRIERFQRNGLVAKVYGWSATADACCPTYEMEILYLFSNGTLVADRALYVEPLYDEEIDPEEEPTTYRIREILPKS